MTRIPLPIDAPLEILNLLAPLVPPEEAKKISCPGKQFSPQRCRAPFGLTDAGRPGPGTAPRSMGWRDLATRVGAMRNVFASSFRLSRSSAWPQPRFLWHCAPIGEPPEAIPGMHRIRCCRPVYRRKADCHTSSSSSLQCWAKTAAPRRPVSFAPRQCRDWSHRENVHRCSQLAAHLRRTG